MKKNLWWIVSLFFILPMTAQGAGAIAVDDEVGETEPGYGYVTGAESRDKAGQDALKQCRENGNEHCKVVARFDECGAYVASKKYYGVGWGSSKEAAVSMATEKCGTHNCRVVVAECE
ncbi:MAG: DUF4189 domain-containing protein [Magnetococcales bacterium]|nr:DUF4189 domain-containing protein [Magnetococcales bacterium]